MTTPLDDASLALAFTTDATEFWTIEGILDATDANNGRVSLVARVPAVPPTALDAYRYALAYNSTRRH